MALRWKPITQAPPYILILLKGLDQDSNVQTKAASYSSGRWRTFDEQPLTFSPTHYRQLSYDEIMTYKSFLVLCAQCLKETPMSQFLYHSDQKRDTICKPCRAANAKATREARNLKRLKAGKLAYERPCIRDKDGKKIFDLTDLISEYNYLKSIHDMYYQAKKIYDETFKKSSQ